MQQAEAACPPATLGVQVSSSGEQNVEHLGTACVDDCGGVEWTDGFIDLGLELGMAIKDRPNNNGLIAPECLFQFFDRVGVYFCAHSDTVPFKIFPQGTKPARWSVWRLAIFCG